MNPTVRPSVLFYTPASFPFLVFCFCSFLPPTAVSPLNFPSLVRSCLPGEKLKRLGEIFGTSGVENFENSSRGGGKSCESIRGRRREHKFYRNSRVGLKREFRIPRCHFCVSHLRFEKYFAGKGERKLGKTAEICKIAET